MPNFEALGTPLVMNEVLAQILSTIPKVTVSCSCAEVKNGEENVCRRKRDRQENIEYMRGKSGPSELSFTVRNMTSS